jgi:phosphonate transport system ATP-binding protein
MASQPHLTLSGVGVMRGGRWLFRGVQWEVPPGKFVAVVGPSGAGKSSLLACLAGMLEPSEGRLSYRCHAGCTHDPSGYRRKMGIVFQNFCLCGNSTVLTNVLLGRLARYHWWQTLCRFPRHEREAAFRWLTELGLGQLAHRRVAEVSGGEQQRTAILRALFQEPEMILADEPVSNLDAYLAGRVLGILRLQAHQRKCTVFCVLHDAALVERFADYALSLDPLNPSGWKVRELRENWSTPLVA